MGEVKDAPLCPMFSYASQALLAPKIVGCPHPVRHPEVGIAKYGPGGRLGLG